LAFARSLILAKEREAAKSLNRLVDVLGPGTDPSLLIARIDGDFGLKKAREQAALDTKSRSDLEHLLYSVRRLGYYKEARELAELLGYQTAEVGGGWLSDPSVTIKSQNGDSLSFDSPRAFVAWVRKTLCGNL
jgi:hypothetical protein